MARIRTIKPEFWTDEQIMELSTLARLCFIGMWSFCDDSGVHPASAKTLKAEIFPCDAVSVADVLGMVSEMISQSLVEWYEVDGKAYWIVSGWHHQKIDQPTYKYPLPDGTFPGNQPRRRISQNKCVRRTLDEHSPNTSRTPDERSPSVHPRKGKESRGEEIKPKPLKSSSSSSPEELTTQGREETQQTATETKMTTTDLRFLFNEAFGQLMPGGCVATAEELCREFSAAAIRDAFQAAAVHGRPNLAYVRGVLRGGGTGAGPPPRRQQQSAKTFEQIKMERTKQAMREFVEGGEGDERSGQTGVCVDHGRTGGRVSGERGAGDDGRVFPLPRVIPH